MVRGGAQSREGRMERKKRRGSGGGKASFEIQNGSWSERREKARKTEPGPGDAPDEGGLGTARGGVQPL